MYKFLMIYTLMFNLIMIGIGVSAFTKHPDYKNLVMILIFLPMLMFAHWTWLL